MIRRITDFTPYMDWIEGFRGDGRYSDPMLSTEEQIACNLLAAATKPEKHALGVFRGGEMIGLFVLLILPDERYIEMLAGLSRSSAAYEELLRHLAAQYPGYLADFVFNPDNDLLKSALTARGAEFCPEQQKMIFTHDLPAVSGEGIELLSAPYMAQYLAMHNTDMYWTGEKVAAATERFRTFLAVEDGTVAGYLDVTHCYEENEPYDLLVLPAYRRKGWGRKLLAAALRMNEPKDMMLLVETDNAPAIRLYESMGFEAVPGQNSLTVHWQIE